MGWRGARLAGRAEAVPSCPVLRRCRPCLLAWPETGLDWTGRGGTGERARERDSRERGEREAASERGWRATNRSVPCLADLGACALSVPRNGAELYMLMARTARTVSQSTALCRGLILISSPSPPACRTGGRHQACAAAARIYSGLHSPAPTAPRCANSLFLVWAACPRLAMAAYFRSQFGHIGTYSSVVPLVHDLDCGFSLVLILRSYSSFLFLAALSFLW